MVKTNIFFIIVLIIGKITYAQPFYEQVSNVMNFRSESATNNIVVFDFTGNSKNDILIFNYYDNPFMVALGLDPRYSNRSAVYPQSLIPYRILSTQNFAYTIVPPSQNEKRENLALAANDGMMEIIRYINDEDIFIGDRYKRFDYLLLTNGPNNNPTLANIQSMTCANVSGGKKPGDVDLIAVAYNYFIPQLLVYTDPFQRYSNKTQSLSPAYQYIISETPSKISALSIDSDDREDIFFELENEWSIWLCNKNGEGFEPNNPERAFTSPIPQSIQHSVDIIHCNDEYPILVGVQTDADSDIAYMFFTKDDLSQPIPVSIPDKYLQGNTSRLFQYENQKTGESYPICIVYTPLDRENPQPNTFTIYKIDPNDPTTPQFVQEFRPEYVSSSGEFYYFDRPETVCDIDNDGVSDIGMMAIGFESFTHALFLGYMGIASETGADGWRLY